MRWGKKSGVEVAAGERVLAATSGVDGSQLAGTRDALYLVCGGQAAVRLPWEQVEAANWDRDSETLRISEVGSWGQQRREYAVVLPEPTRLVELVRERVIASVVVKQFVPIEAGKGLRVIGRRAPRGTRPITWLYEYDEGIDPADSAVVAAASQALERIRLDLGLG